MSVSVYASDEFVYRAGSRNACGVTGGWGEVGPVEGTGVEEPATGEEGEVAWAFDGCVGE